MPQFPMSATTATALRTLLAVVIKEVVVRADLVPVRQARADARRLHITSPDGQRYSGVVVIHDNAVTTGAVVLTTPATAEVSLLPDTSADALHGLRTVTEEGVTP